MSYRSFARFYDALTRDVDYRARAAFFDSLIRRYGKNAKIVLDLACGTGSLSIELAALSYDVIGADASAEMLSLALQKTVETGHKILYLHQAMDELDLYGTVDVTVCALDSINHIASVDALDAVFAKVSLFTNPAGLFIFDVNTAYKHRQILGDNVFVRDLPEVFCVWQNSYSAADGSVDMALDFFEPRPDGSYQRYGERFSEYVYSDEVLRSLMRKNGFKHMQTLEGDSLFPASQTAERLVYIAKKIDEVAK